MRVGELIRTARRDRGLDQAALAHRAGTTQSYVSRVERGALTPSLDTLERLLHAMGHRLSVAIEPLSPGNVSVERVRADLTELTASQRIEQAFELSELLTSVATSSAERRSDGGS